MPSGFRRSGNVILDINKKRAPLFSVLKTGSGQDEVAVLRLAAGVLVADAAGEGRAFSRQENRTTNIGRNTLLHCLNCNQVDQSRHWRPIIAQVRETVLNSVVEASIAGEPTVMIERLTVIFFIILCLLLGFYLILSPWDTLFGNWSENYLLVFVSEGAGLPALQSTVTSNWFRGAVTGLGVLNLIIAFWEVAHFEQSVALLREHDLNKSGK
jgi:hypothetical protein